MTTLNRRIAIYVPSTIGFEKAPKATVAFQIRKAKTLLADLFGGFTATEGIGGWISQTKGLIEESVTIIASHTDDCGAFNNLPLVKKLAAEIARDMQQECVSVQVDNALEFVWPK